MPATILHALSYIYMPYLKYYMHYLIHALIPTCLTFGYIKYHIKDITKNNYFG